MAQRRMFSVKIVDSDVFLDMPQSSQLLYFHLGMHADDDGFVNPKKIMRVVGSQDDDLRVLIAKRFVLLFENGVIVIKHWLINNLIRKDFYQETVYLDQKNTLKIKDNKSYTENCKQIVNNLDTQVRLGKISSIVSGNSKYSDNSKDDGNIELLDTPSNEMKDFITNSERQNVLISHLVGKGIPENIARLEIYKFIEYWTERNKSGTKQKWELEKTFELKRRLNTWFRNMNQFSKSINFVKIS